MALRILFTGGGTGGHVYPLVAVAQEIKKKAPDTEMKFIGAGDLLVKEADALGIKATKILAPKWRRYFSISNFIDLLKIPIGFLQSFFSIVFFMPDVIFAKGGYGSFLPLLVAKMFFIPIVIHESDAIPGAVNRRFGNKARMVFLGFESAKRYFKHKRLRVVGVPLRDEVIKAGIREQGLKTFELDNTKPVVFITGSSQGAKKINDILLLALIRLVPKYHIIHQCGASHYEEIKGRVNKIIEQQSEFASSIKAGYRLYATLAAKEYGLALAACDIVLSRASSSIFEIAAVGKPSIVIPLPSAANNHQALNAQEFSKYGAFVLSERNFSPGMLIRALNTVYDNRIELGARIRRFAKPDAAVVIADYLLT